LTALLPLAAGALLLWLSVPQLMSAGATLADAAAAERLRARQPISDDEADRLIASREEGLAWAGDARHVEELALALAERAAHAGPRTPAGAALLQQARRVLVDGLRRAPADSYLWAHLAFVDGHLQAPPETVLDSLRMSILSNRLNPQLAPWRLRIAYQNIAHWTPEMAQLLRSQIRVVARTGMDDLVQLGRDPRFLPLVQQSLDGDPVLLGRFSAALAVSLIRKNWSARESGGQGGQ
jgi:hypothetical protein